MAAIYHHARRVYIGTEAEMAAVAATLDVDGVGTKYWDTTYARQYIWNGAIWVVGEVPLVFLGNYAQKCMIRGGAMDWETFSAAAAGYAIVSTGISPAFDQTPTWTGVHLFSAGAAVAAGQAITMGAGATIDGLDLSELGAMLFDETDGLLLLGPDGEITPAGWWSLRKQKATLTGAFHQEAGRWSGTKGLVVEPAATNIVENPSFGVNVIDWWDATGNGTSTRITTDSRFGSACDQITAGVAHNPYLYKQNAVVNPGQGDDFTFFAWVKGVGASIGETARVVLRETGGVAGDAETGVNITMTSYWQRVQVTRTIVEADRTGLFCMVRLYIDNTEYGYVDGIQLEAEAYATTYCDGSLGTGYIWTGAAHASTSTRTVTEVNLDALVGTINNNDTISVRVVAQMPYDYDADWPAGRTYLLDIYDAGTGGRHRLSYRDDTDVFELIVTDGVDSATLSVAATFSAGDWIDIVYTCDFAAAAAGDYNLYVNGVLGDTDVTANVAAPTLTQWNLGSAFNATVQGGFCFSEYAVFDRVLTATEIANLHALQRPIVDTAALDPPSPMMDGLYGYERFGGFCYWEGMVMAGGEVEVIPDGAGDVVYGMRAMCIATDRGANTVQSTYSIDTPGAGSNTTGIYLAGADSVSLRLYSTGRLTVDETAGTGAIYVNLILMWQ